jgi:hypothetical protein
MRRDKRAAGNKQADASAKAGCHQPEPAEAVPMLAYIQAVVQAWWDASAPNRYKILKLQFPSGCPLELSLPWSQLHHLPAARSQHRDFADYHERSNHNEVRITCSCGQHKDFNEFIQLLKASSFSKGSAHSTSRGIPLIALSCFSFLYFSLLWQRQRRMCPHPLPPEPFLLSLSSIRTGP